MNDTRLLLTVPEAAERLRLGRSKIYELMQSREIAAVRVGRSVRIPVSALNEFVAKLEEESRDPLGA